MKKRTSLGQKILAAVLATSMLLPLFPLSALASQPPLPDESAVTASAVEEPPAESAVSSEASASESKAPAVSSEGTASEASQAPAAPPQKEEPAESSERAPVISTPASSEPDASESSQVVRQPKDWSADHQALNSLLYRARITDEDPVTEIKAAGGLLDLSGVSAGQLNRFVLDCAFSFAAGTKLVAGDTFTWKLPQEWTIEDTNKPIKVYNSDAGDITVATEKQVASYEIKKGELKVTLKKEAEELSKVEALLSLTLSINQKVLSDQGTTRIRFGKDQQLVLPVAPVPESSAVESAVNSQPELAVSNPESSAASSESVSQVSSEPAEGDSSQLQSSELAESSQLDESVPEEQPEGESLGDQVRAFFSSLFGAFSASNQENSGKDAGQATVSKYTITKAELPVGFDTVKMTVGSKAGGYTKDDPGPVSFGVEVYPDEDYLFDQSELMMKYPDFPLQGTADWEISVRLWLEAHKTEFPPLTLSYSLGELFGTSSFGEQELKQGDELIATYWLDQGVLKFTLDPLCYFSDSIYLKFSFDALLDASKLDDEPKNVVFGDDNKLVLEKVGAVGGDDPEAKKYHISKSAPDRVSDISIPYEIDIQAPKGETLNSTWLKDILPEGLRVEEMQVSFNDGAAFIPAEGDYLADNGKTVLYQLNDAQDITKVHVALRLQLDDARYQQCIDQGGISGDLGKFYNDASLLDQEQKKTLAESEKVFTQMTVTFLKKSGREADLAGKRFLWTIELSTYLPYLDYGYLVDTLRSTDHMYDFGSGITIKAAGKPTQTITNVQKITGTVAWENITADALHKLAADAGLAADQAFYYSYQEAGSANPFVSSGETAETERSVLVLPYNGLQGPYEESGQTVNSRKVTIQYYSDLNMHGLDQDSYWQALQDANYTTSITNAVNIVWKNQDGKGGPGNPYQDQIDIGKNPVSSVGTVEKRAVSYNQSKHEMTWAIDVNKLGVNMDNVVVTDVLPKGAYDLSNLTLKYYRYHIPALGQQVLADEGECNKDAPFDPAGQEPGYTLTTDASGNEVLTVSFGDMLRQDGYDYYTVLFTVPLKDPASLAAQGKNELKNSASMTYDGVQQPVLTEAKISIPTTLVKKDTVGSYDYAAHTLNWKVTINPEHTYLKDLVATDTLEAGFSFGQVTKATKIGADGTETVLPASEYSLQVTPDSNGDKMVFANLAEGKNTYVFEFTTIASSQWRQINLDKGNQDIIVPNEVMLEGTVISEANQTVTAPITDAIAGAEHAVAPRPLQKTGKYNKETGTIDWTITVNENRRDIAGLKLEEILTEAGKAAIHELDVDSIRVAELGTDTDVTATAGALSDVTGNGFAYTFQANSGAMNETAYKVTFRTELTGDALGATIKNKVYLKDSQGGIIEESNEHNGGYGGDFNFEENVEAKKRPHITLHKISSNSVEESNEIKSLPLAHAEFTLSAYTYQWDQGTNTVTLDQLEEVRYSKDAESDAEGNLSFYNLKTANAKPENLIYVLEEITAAPGYVLDPTNKHFFGFDTAMPSTVSIRFNSENYTNKLQIIDTKSAAAEASAKITYTNTPVATSFSFDKQYLSGLIIDETVTPATDTKQYSSLAGAVFKIEPTGDLMGKVQTRYVTADSSGIMTLANLDAGTYKMTEVASAANVSVGGTVPLTVAWDDTTKQYTYAFGTGTGGITVEGTTLKDDALRTDFSFTKNVQYADGAKEKDALKGATFLLEGTALGDASNTVTKTATSANNGRATFKDLPVGDYKIYEIENPNGYKLESNKVHLYDLEVVDVEDTSKVLGQNGSDVYYAHKAVATATVVRTPVDDGIDLRKDTNTTIDNSPIRGTISFTKIAYDASLTGINNVPLEGATFGLFRKVGTSVSRDATYQAISDAAGKVSFDGVEYGDYVLKETAAPEGYTKTADINITKANLATAFTPGTPDKADSFDYMVKQSGQTENVVTDKLYRADLTLTKQQEDGTTLAGITFDVYRRGNAVTSADGSDFVAVVPNNQITFGAYAPLAQVTTNNKGELTGLNLPYGDYLLIEQDSGLGLQDGHSKPAVLVSLTNAKTGIYLRDALVPNTGGSYETATPNAGNWTAEQGKWTQLNKNNEKTATVVNHRKYAFLHLTKQTAEVTYTQGIRDTDLDLNGSKKLAGATFEIKKEGKAFLTLKTDATGQFVPDADGNYIDANDSSVKKHLVYGDYTIQEITAPAGFTVNPKIIAFTVGNQSDHLGNVWIGLNQDTVTVTYTKEGDPKPDAEKQTVYNEITRGMLTVKKTDTTGTKLLEGAEFQVLDGSKPVAGLVSDSHGIAKLSNKLGTTTFNESKNGIPYLYQTDGEWRLLTGDYTLKEITAPEAYYPAADQNFTMTTAGKNITVKNELILSAISLTKVKTGTTTPLADVAFTLYDSKNTVVETKTTDADGKLTFQDVPAGTYTIKENLMGSEDAPGVYINEGWSKTVIVDESTHKKTIEVGIVENDAFAAALSLQKVDAVDLTGLSDVTFRLDRKTGSSYQPYEQNGNSGKYTTENGLLSISNLIKGDYRLTEVTAASGYLLGDQPFQVQFTVVNGDQGKTIAITKANADSGKHALNVIQGENLLTEQGLTNVRQTGTLTLQKADSTDDSGLDGVTFTLYQKKDGNWLEQAWNFLTGKEYDKIDDVQGNDLATAGQLVINGLLWGDYKLVETGALSGYILDRTEYQFTIGKTNTSMVLAVDQGVIKNIPNTVTLEKRGRDLQPGNDGKGNLLDGAEFTITNTKNPADTHKVTVTGGSIELPKLLTGGVSYTITETKAPVGYRLAAPITITMGTDGVVTGTGVQNNIVTVMDDPTYLSFQKKGKINESCADPKQGIFDPEEVQPLKGAEFAVYAASAPDVAVQTAVSDENGLVEFFKLPIGDYRIKETKVPEGYQLDTTVYTAKLTGGTFEGLRKDGTLVAGNSVINDVYRTDLQFTKVKEDATDETLPGSTYGLYRKNTISRSKEELLVATAVTDQNGVLTFRGVLMDTAYVVRELAPPDGSYLSKHPIEITFAADKDGKVTVRDFNDGAGTATMDPITGEIVWLEPTVVVGIEKKMPDGSLLAGAELEIQDQEGNVVASWISDTTKHNIAGVLVAGESYTLVEKKAPAGYYAADPVAFTIDDKPAASGENRIISLSMVDEPTQYSFLKVDGNNNPLSGAELEIRDKDGKIVEAWISGAEAHSITGKLIAGANYTLVETKAPKGYYIADPIPFTVAEDFSELEEPVVSISMKDEAIQYSFLKTDADKNPLPGAALQIRDKDGVVVTEWTSGTEAHEVVGLLTAGERYTFEEQTPPEGYQLAEPITFTVAAKFSEVTSQSALSLTMVDRPIVLKLFKTDAATGKHLSGAQFTLKGSFADGTAHQTVSPSADGIALTAMLKAGEIYQLTENAAPNGYVKREQLPDILVGSDGTISLSAQTKEVSLTEQAEGFELTVTNEKDTSSSKPESSEPESNGTGTKTGDSGTMPLWLLLFGMAGGSVFAVGFSRRKSILASFKKRSDR